MVKAIGCIALSGADVLVKRLTNSHSNPDRDGLLFVLWQLVTPVFADADGFVTIEAVVDESTPDIELNDHFRPDLSLECASPVVEIGGLVVRSVDRGAPFDIRPAIDADLARRAIAALGALRPPS